MKNRIWFAPMCQYAVESEDGVPTDWHLVHLGARAQGGFGLILAEATAVTPEGRISAQDTGLWNDEQRDAWARIVDFVHTQDAAIGVQLAHAGRKASTYRGFPGEPSGSVPPDAGGWTTIGPSAEAFVGYTEPVELSSAEISEVVAAFAESARRADEAGFDVVEIHAAHGYLIHQFLSPLSNHRTDAYGGDFAGRTRLALEVAEAVRAVWPQEKPLFVRISATDWTEGGWDADQSVPTRRRAAGAGRRSGRHLHRRERAGRDPGRAGLPGPVRAQIREQAADPDRRGGTHPGAAAGREDPGRRRCRCRAAGRGRPCGSRPGRSGPPPSWVCPGVMLRIRPRTCVAAGTTYRLGDRYRAG